MTDAQYVSHTNAVIALEPGRPVPARVALQETGLTRRDAAAFIEWWIDLGIVRRGPHRTLVRTVKQMDALAVQQVKEGRRYLRIRYQRPTWKKPKYELRAYKAGVRRALEMRRRFDDAVIRTKVVRLVEEGYDIELNKQLAETRYEPTAAQKAALARQRAKLAKKGA